MGDSEDEYDRKRRDKFRGERTEPYQRGEGRRGLVEGEGRRREEWVERDFQRGNRNHSRGDYREYRGAGARERYSPGRTLDIALPPIKRMRTDWGDDRRTGSYGHDTGYSDAGYSSSWQHGGYGGQHSSYGASSQVSRGGVVEASETQPPMMSFKSYLLTQDDNITDEDAIKKYNEYKLEFKRQQLNEFFISHKDEEWFKTKYHPEEASKRKTELTNALLNRVKVYNEFIDTGRVDKVSVDSDKSDELIKLLDAVVVRLEGGTDLDLQALEEDSTVKEPSSSKQSHSERSPNERRSEEKKEAKAEEPKRKPVVLLGDNEEPVVTKPAEVKVAEETPEPVEMDSSLEQDELLKEATEVTKPTTAEGSDSPPKDTDKKRKRSYSDSGSESGDEPDAAGLDTDEPRPPGLDEDSAPLTEPLASLKGGKVDKEENTEKSDSKLDNEAEDISDKEDNEKMGSIPEEGEERAEGDEHNIKEQSRSSTPEVSRPRLLHRTASIFLRNLAPTITKLEVETMCGRYPGFMRVAIADPQPERRWFRRGWVTMERNVNIKDVCWNLNNIRLRDCELGAIVNRDLSRRIRTVNGITVHKQVVRNDIKLSARIVHNLDSRAGLWDEAKAAEEEKKINTSAPKKQKLQDLPSFNLASKNPVLQNITDYLIEEASAEEDELLGMTADSEEGQIDDSTVIFRDDNLIRVLDRLLLYLRIVHSVDYYNHCEYPNEDEMPNRCGIMHARGIPPTLKQLSHDEISDYCRTFESKIASFLQPVPRISDDEYSKLGHKDPDAEVEKFVKANTQELAKDKWLCPLSGKKFKGPDFVRKHIFNKHTEKVDEVRKEVEYFNNYLRDPKRPQLAEHIGSRQRKDGGLDREGYAASSQPYIQSSFAGNSYGGYGGGRSGYGGGHSYGGGYQGYTQGYSRPRGGGFNRGRGGGSSEFRPVIHYRDLDAPREAEEFI